MIKLLAFDLDGTTITQHKYISKENREALLRAWEAGVTLVPATGRMKDFIPEEILSLPGLHYEICLNGASVYDLRTGEALFHHLIPNETARQIQQLLNDYDIFLEYYGDGLAFTKVGYPTLAKTHFHLPESKWHFIDGKTYHFTDDFSKMLEETGMCPEKINLPYLPGALRSELWEKLSRFEGLRLTSSIPDNLEINSSSADKGRALLRLAELLGLGPEELLAVGDNGNDVSMLEAAGCSAAVADGAPEALAAAKHIVAAHDKNGLAEAVNRFILHP